MPALFLVLLACMTIGLPAFAQGEAGNAALSGCEFSDTVRASRPGDNRETTRVRVAVYLVDIPDIDDVEQSFVADVLLRYRWQDTRLANGRSSACIVPLADIWNPGALIVNQRNVTRQMPETAEVLPDGTVSYLQRFYGSFALPLDLRHFPFDRQQLPVTLVARYSPQELKLEPDSEMVAVKDHLSNPNWSIGRPEVTTGVYDVYPGRSITKLEFAFPAYRHSGYYIWKLAVPMSLVVFMSWAVFWLAPQNIGPRVALAATSMLTLIAFRLALSSSLPPIPYLTGFDVFTIAATVLVFAALLQAVGTSALWEAQRQEIADRTNRVSRVVFPAVFILATALSLGRLALGQ